MRFFDGAAVDAALSYPALIDILEAAFVKGAISPLRHHHAISLDGRPEAMLLLMPAWEESASGSGLAGRYIGLVLCGGNIDTRLLASVLTRELAREGRLSQLTIDLVDRPGTLAKVANLLGEVGANIVEVYHQRVFSDLPAKGALLEVVIETRDRAHLDETVGKLRTAGMEVEVKSNPGGNYPSD